MDTAIQREKLEQAIGLLDACDVDCWLTFARASSETPDPALKLIAGHDVTWQSAFLVARDEPEPPAAVARAFRACVDAIESARKVLKAGMIGWQVDAVARESLVAAGYPAYNHALGHSVGLACHDGGSLIGPRWSRYGETPERPIEPASVYTLELGTHTERGYIGLEDEVLVTEDGADYLSSVQRELIFVG